MPADISKHASAPQDAWTFTELDMAAVLCNVPTLIEAHSSAHPTDSQRRAARAKVTWQDLSEAEQADLSLRIPSVVSTSATRGQGKSLAEAEDLWAAAEKANRAASRRASFLATMTQQ